MTKVSGLIQKVSIFYKYQLAIYASDEIDNIKHQCEIQNMCRIKSSGQKYIYIYIINTYNLIQLIR